MIHIKKNHGLAGARPQTIVSQGARIAVRMENPVPMGMGKLLYLWESPHKNKHKKTLDWGRFCFEPTLTSISRKTMLRKTGSKIRREKF